MNRFHIPLQKAVIECAVGLGATFKTVQCDRSFVGRLRITNDLVERSLNRLFALLGYFVVALIALRCALQFLCDSAAQLTHLVAQIDDSQMIGAIFLGPIRGSRVIFEVLAAQLRDHIVMQCIGNSCSGRCARIDRAGS